MFSFILFWNIAVPVQTLHYCTILNLKNFRFGQVSCGLRVLFPSWWKIKLFHVSNQCFDFLFKGQFLHCIRPPLFRCIVMALMAMIKLKRKSGWVKSGQIDLSVKPSNFKTVSFRVHFIFVKISVFQELVSMWNRWVRRKRWNHILLNVYQQDQLWKKPLKKKRWKKKTLKKNR